MKTQEQKAKEQRSKRAVARLLKRYSYDDVDACFMALIDRGVVQSNSDVTWPMVEQEIDGWFKGREASLEVAPATNFVC